MSDLIIPNGYDDQRIPAQGAFRRSKATLRAYGGAMGGGKSFALCQEAFDWALDYPGILLPIFRQKHTAITLSTRKTFMDQVLPSELRERKDLVRVKESQGQDFVEFLWNGSQIHFVGLDDPGKWFSTEFGGAMLDEAHEISEEDAITVNSRLRQRCQDCVKYGMADCQHMPNRMVLTFNPSFPGHWLHRWFVLGGQRTEWGWVKPAVHALDAEDPLGDGEYFISKAQDNPFLARDYLSKNLAGLKPKMRQRYLDGDWIHLHGTGFFDDDALTRISEQLVEPILTGTPAGDPSGKDPDNRPQISPARNGGMEVWKAPVRWHTTGDGSEVPEHRYVVAADPSGGAGADYSAIQVIDATEWEQVAEWQGKIDPDRLGDLAFLTACVYNGATIAIEINAGWGLAATTGVKRLIAGWKGNAASKPRIYMRPVTDRLSDKFTDLLGWSTDRKSRAHMLTVLEESLRDDILKVYGQRTLAELAAFAWKEKEEGSYGIPSALSGQHDDLVIALAIGVAIIDRMPKRRITDQPLALSYS